MGLYMASDGPGFFLRTGPGPTDRKSSNIVWLSPQLILQRDTYGYNFIIFQDRGCLIAYSYRNII